MKPHLFPPSLLLSFVAVLVEVLWLLEKLRAWQRRWNSQRGVAPFEIYDLHLLLLNRIVKLLRINKHCLRRMRLNKLLSCRI